MILNYSSLAIFMVNLLFDPRYLANIVILIIKHEYLEIGVCLQIGLVRGSVLFVNILVHTSAMEKWTV